MNAITQPEAAALAEMFLEAPSHRRTLDHIESLHAELTVDEQENRLRAMFVAAAKRGHLADQVLYAPQTVDYSRGAMKPFKRQPTVAEILADSLDFNEGPSCTDLAVFVAKRAAGGDVEADVLLQRMASVWAHHAVGLEG